MQSRRDLVFVSAGLDLDGGGRALAGRLLARTCAAFAREWGIGFEVLALGRNGSPVPASYFGSRQRALALEVWRRQWRSRRSAYVYDLLGPARIQSWLPAAVRAPYLVPLYGIEVWRPLGWDRRRALAKATVLFSISEHTLDRARPFCPGLHGVPVLPLTLEERAPEGALDEALLARLGHGFLLLVGRMASGERYKGHDQLLEALPRLLAAHPDTRLVVAGEGNDRPRLEAKAAALGLREAAVFPGFVSEATLSELYRRCAAFVMPSRGEGFGLVYLEAMRAGKPCVAARGSAAEEVMEDGVTGLLVEPEPEALASALGSLLGQPELARRMGEAGQRRWRERFGAERFEERLRPLIEKMVHVRH
jgi:phosphatidyl-myo-inositol dimannoside synthase